MIGPEKPANWPEAVEFLIVGLLIAFIIWRVT